MRCEHVMIPRGFGGGEMICAKCDYYPTPSRPIDCPIDDCQDTFPSTGALAEHVDFDHCETCGFGTKDPSGRHHTAWCPEGV